MGTLIVALPGVSDIVVGADMYKLLSGDNGEHYGFQGHKIGVFGGKFILGVANSDVGFSILRLMQTEGFPFEGNFTSFVGKCQTRMHELYKLHGYTSSTSIIACGCDSDGPRVANWTFPEQPGPEFSNSYRALGARGGAIRMMGAYYDPKLTTDQRKLLAYMCLAETALSEPAVRHPFELGVVTADLASRLEESAFSDIATKGEAVLRGVRKRIHSFRIDGKP